MVAARGERMAVNISELNASDQGRQAIEMRIRGMQMKEIGVALGVTEGRASQIITKVIEDNREI
jgi:DNA-directed RNA polymerase specialized sigma subunit